jgi:Holliday junction DNA helicase RuvA
VISFVRGKLASKSPTEIVVDVNGVGYSVSVPLSTSGELPQVGDTVTILTYTHVREDVLQLYGFASELERELFLALISVTGIGPKMAQGILSGMNASELREAIVSENLIALTSIPGVGRKTAERVILELRSKLGKIEFVESSAPSTSKQLKSRSEALIALMSLGYSRPNAEKALRQVLGESKGNDLPVEELIKRALHHAAK